MTCCSNSRRLNCDPDGIELGYFEFNVGFPFIAWNQVQSTPDRKSIRVLLIRPGANMLQNCLMNCRVEKRERGRIPSLLPPMKFEGTQFLIRIPEPNGFRKSVRPLLRSSCKGVRQVNPHSQAAGERPRLLQNHCQAKPPRRGPRPIAGGERFLRAPGMDANTKEP